MGRPVIASTARGNAELVGTSGFLTEVGDIAGIARAMDRLAVDQEMQAQMGSLARARMVERYDVARVTRLHEDAL